MLLLIVIYLINYLFRFFKYLIWGYKTYIILILHFCRNTLQAKHKQVTLVICHVKDHHMKQEQNTNKG